MSYYAAAGMVIILMATGQVLMKAGSKKGQSWLASFFNPLTLLGYGLYFGVTILNIYALQGIYLKYITAWMGLTYVLVVFLSYLVLKEKLSWPKVCGSILIALGVLIFSFPY